MALHDPTPTRVSACPVHFLWDGRGKGRAFVRAGFLGFLVAALFALGAEMTRVDALRFGAWIVVSASAFAYLLGQCMSFIATRVHRAA